MSEILVGSRVYLISFADKILGTKIRDGLFMSDQFDSRLHNGGGRGDVGYYWFIQDSSIQLAKPIPRKKTGFAKFIQKVENA